MPHNKYIRLYVKGMHCPSCELLIGEKLKEIVHVKSADLNYKTGEVVVYYENHAPSEHLITKAITAAGYEPGQPDKLPLMSREKKEYASLGVAFLFLMVLYLVFKSLGLTNINLSPNLSSPSWGLIALIGLVAGFSTCMALVGGLSLGLSAKFSENNPTATPAEKFRPHIFFIIGRILIYTLLGGLLGALGTVLQFSSAMNGLLTILVGIVMLIMGLQLINIFPRLSKFKLTLPKGISRALGLKQKDKVYSHQRAMIMGGLTFFLPCGFTQAMQLYAISTGDFGYGALTMGLFALGTAPGLLSVGGVTSLVRGSFKEKFFKVAGLAVIFFALFNLNNGYTLAGFSLNDLRGKNSSQTSVVSDPNVIMDSGVQVVRMIENSDGYSPNKFSIKKGVPVRWEIDAKAPYSCASSLVVSKLGIQKSLKAGQNVIEFTPDEVGRLPFSCSMGMYTGLFTVYDENVSAPDNVITEKDAGLASAVKSPAGTCGAGGGGCGCGGGSQQPVNTNSNPITAATTQDASTKENIQVVKTTYTAAKYLDPSVFKVKTGIKVRLEIDVRDNGVGCGYALTIPGLYDSLKPLRAGVPIIMEFTPTVPGSYDITCGMNMINFGSIIVE